MNVSVLGRTYGIFEGERLACAAQTSAESSLSAMIVGVATDPDFRGRGYAKASVLKLCADCLEEGRQFVCLFFDNPDAGGLTDPLDLPMWERIPCCEAANRREKRWNRSMMQAAVVLQKRRGKKPEGRRRLDLRQ